MRNCIITALLLVSASAVAQTKPAVLEATAKSAISNNEQVVTATNTTGFIYQPLGKKPLKAVFDSLAAEGYVLNDGWSEPVSGVFTVRGKETALTPQVLRSALNLHGIGAVEFQNSQGGLIGQPAPVVIKNTGDKKDSGSDFSSNIYLNYKDASTKLIHYDVNISINREKYMSTMSSVIKLAGNSVIIDIRPMNDKYIILFTSVDCMTLNKTGSQN